MRTRFLPVMIGVLATGLAVLSVGAAEDPCCQGLREGRPAQAVDACSQLIQAGAGSPVDLAALHHNRGLAWLGLGELDKALSDLDQAVALSPEDGWFFNSRGTVRGRRGEMEQALADLRRAVELLPGEPLPRANLGQVLLSLGEGDKALIELNRALAIKGDYIPALYQRGLLFNQRGNAAAALADFNLALKLQPELAPVLIQRGMILGRQGEHRKALADLDRGIGLDREDASAYAGRALIHKKLGHYQQALADYRKALEIEPELAPALNGLAWLLATCPVERWRDGKQAVELAQRAVDMRQDAVRLDTLAAALAEAGRPAEAARTQARALSLLGPSSGVRLAAEYRRRLKSYQEGKAWRDQP